MLSMYEVAPSRSVRGIKLWVGETRIEAPRKECRGLTQVEFDPASMVGAAGNSKDAGDLRWTERRNKNGRSALRPLFPERKRSGSGAAPPQTAVAPRHEWQVVLVAGPLLVLRQLDLFLRRLPAFPFARHGLHRRRGVLQESELVLRVLLGPQSVTRPGMAGNEAFPIHRQHLLDRLLRLERIEVDHAAARHRSDREEIHHEKDLLLRQPHDKGAVGVVETEIAQLERGAAQSDGPLLVERLVGKRRGRISED